MLTSHVEDRGNAWRIVINTEPKRTIRAQLIEKEYYGNRERQKNHPEKK
jgi:hypothetical protein